MLRHGEQPLEELRDHLAELELALELVAALGVLDVLVQREQRGHEVRRDPRVHCEQRLDRAPVAPTVPAAALL